MHKSVQITLIVSSAVIILVLISVFSFSNFISSKRVIDSQGYAEISVMPDLVTINFKIETKGNTTKQANDKNKEILSSLTANLISQGFKEDDIKTVNYNIYPNYAWINKKRVQNGYKATRRVKIELSEEDFDKLSTVIDAGINANASLSHINFELTPEKQNQYKTKAIKLASEDAKQKAEAMAQGLGQKIGKIVSVSNSDFEYRPWLAYSAENSATGQTLETGTEIAQQINPSEKKISARVSASFEIG